MDDVPDDFRFVTCKLRTVVWKGEPILLTDLSVEIDGEVYGARCGGWLNRFEVERVARNTVRKVKQGIWL